MFVTEKFRTIEPPTTITLIKKQKGFINLKDILKPIILPFIKKYQKANLDFNIFE